MLKVYRICFSNEPRRPPPEMVSGPPFRPSVVVKKSLSRKTGSGNVLHSHLFFPTLTLVLLPILSIVFPFGRF